MEELNYKKMIERAFELVEHDKALAELMNKAIRIKARENWANAEVRAYRALKNNAQTAATLYNIHGTPIVDVGVNYAIHRPYVWETIWKLVADKLHRYRRNLVLQYVFGRNPAEICGSPTVIVNKE